LEDCVVVSERVQQGTGLVPDVENWQPVVLSQVGRINLFQDTDLGVKKIAAAIIKFNLIKASIHLVCKGLNCCNNSITTNW
jgi:hypothetical protein